MDWNLMLDVLGALATLAKLAGAVFLLASCWYLLKACKQAVTPSVDSQK